MDPGVRGAGVAIWRDDHLAAAGYVVSTAHGTGPLWLATADAAKDFVEHHLGALPDSVFVELPQVYVRARSKGDPNDLVTLATAAGAIAFALRGPATAVTISLPAAWKGQVPKEIMAARTRARLNAEELRAIELPARHLAHNVYDAVAMGLFHLRRLGAISSNLAMNSR